MRKKILAFVFAAALLVAMATPLFGGVGTALAINDGKAPGDDCSGQASAIGTAGAVGITQADQFGTPVSASGASTGAEGQTQFDAHNETTRC